MASPGKDGNVFAYLLQETVDKSPLFNGNANKQVQNVMTELSKLDVSVCCLVFAGLDRQKVQMLCLKCHSSAGWQVPGSMLRMLLFAGAVLETWRRQHSSPCPENSQRTSMQCVAHMHSQRPSQRSTAVLIACWRSCATLVACE